MVFVLTFFVLVFAYNIVKGISKTWQAGITSRTSMVLLFKWFVSSWSQVSLSVYISVCLGLGHNVLKGF